MISRAAETIANTTAVKIPPAKGKAGQSRDTEFDIIIIGGGTIGLAAAYYAARAGHKTLLLEQFTFWNRYASSGGHSRIFRVMHSHKDPERGAAMVRLAEISLALWQEIEAAGGGTLLLDRRPLLFYGTPKSPSGPEGDLVKMKQTMVKLGVPFTELSAADLRRCFPVFKAIPSDYFGLVQENSAVIRVQDSMRLFENLALREGAVLLEEQPATVIRTSPPYEVSCPAGSYRAKRLILCPGAWTNKVLEPFGLKLELEIWQMTVAYFRVDVGKYEYPLWYEFGPTEDGLFYGFPEDEVPGRIKVSVDYTKHRYKTPEDCTYEPDEEILEKTHKFLRERFKGVQAGPTHKSTCLYTMALDRERILGLLPLPGSPNVAIFTGDSGRGFKFTPLIGRVLVELATTGTTYYNIEPFSPTRPDATGRSLFRTI